ncbi:hypothetical protein F2Q65_18335 [Thiohalocapsa marina]|uniref:Uncharacterized protein n=1 Tax=Thiohalocapsa marina TaxID=424902 RepID=A0A5M8FBZ9_9GAMM|nr:hypothetical protein [Thiohalocapsa marina]KAA6182189.1 hypothetical protein F2Q65_18335 [Thiohalocapsa marina]
MQSIAVCVCVLALLTGGMLTLFGVAVVSPAEVPVPASALAPVQATVQVPVQVPVQAPARAPAIRFSSSLWGIRILQDQAKAWASAHGYVPFVENLTDTNLV